VDIQCYWLDTLMKCKRLFNPDKHCGWHIGIRHHYFNTYHWPATVEYYWPELGLTLDTPEDYKMLTRLFDEFGSDPGFRAEDVIDFLRENPDWITNKDVKRKDPAKEG